MKYIGDLEANNSISYAIDNVYLDHIAYVPKVLIIYNLFDIYYLNLFFYQISI